MSNFSISQPKGRRQLDGTLHARENCHVTMIAIVHYEGYWRSNVACL